MFIWVFFQSSSGDVHVYVDAENTISVIRTLVDKTVPLRDMQKQADYIYITLAVSSCFTDTYHIYFWFIHQKMIKY